MKIFLSPQEDSERIYYKFEGNKVSATIENITDVFDFTDLPDGELELYDMETGEELIKTTLPVNPIISAEKKEGILYLELLNWISEDASDEENFPVWIDSNEYLSPSENVQETPSNEIDETINKNKSVDFPDNTGGANELKMSSVSEDWSDF